MHAKQARTGFLPGEGDIEEAGPPSALPQIFRRAIMFGSFLAGKPRPVEGKLHFRNFHLLFWGPHTAAACPLWQFFKLYAIVETAVPVP